MRVVIDQVGKQYAGPDGSPVIAPPILAGAKLIVQTRSGTLSAFAGE